MISNSNYLDKVIYPIKYEPFKNNHHKFIKGIKSSNPIETKKKRNVILKISHNII